MADKPKPPYRRYAFSNPYNYAVMGSIASAAVLTGNWWLGLAGAGVEAIWMLFAPDSRLLQKTVWDKRHQAEEAARLNAELDAKFRLLPDASRARCLTLRANKEEINKLAAENPAFTQDLLAGELTKLDDLTRGFVEMSVTGARYQEYLESVNLDGIERDIRRYTAILEQSDAKSDKHVLAQKNIAVLQKRKDKYAEIKNYLSSTRGQLELIENTFRLLADQIVTMRSPNELSGQLDELLDGVEAVKQTTRETDRLLQAIEH